MGELSALVVAYTFPPHAAMGTMRTLRLLTCLDREGWRLSVLTGSPGTYLPGTPTDAALVEKVPAHVMVNAVRAWRPLVRLATRQPAGLTASAKATASRAEANSRRRKPGATEDLRGDTTRSTRTPVASRAPAFRRAGVAHASSSSFRRTLRTLFRLPDKEVGWLVPAILAGLRMPSVDVIYSTAPPFSGLVAATLVATLRRTPLVVDFRDPWARAPWREDRPAWAGRIAQWLERLVISKAEAVIFASETNRSEYANWYGPRLAERFHVVRNGCDVSEFRVLQGPSTSVPESGVGSAFRPSTLLRAALSNVEGQKPASTEARERPFVLLHAGSLYGGRNPLPLLEALDRLFRAGVIDRNSFRLKLLGSLSVPGLDLPAMLRKLQLESNVEIRERVPRHEALREMVSADALLLLQPGTTVSIPGKLYEYFAAERPIFAIVEAGEVAELVRSTSTGVVAYPGDSPAIEAGLRRLVIDGLPEFRSAPETLYDGMTRAAEAVDVLRRGALSRRARRAAYNEA